MFFSSVFGCWISFWRGGKVFKTQKSLETNIKNSHVPISSIMSNKDSGPAVNAVHG